MPKAQEWLDKRYPKEERRWIVGLNLSSSRTLTGSLDLTDFGQLRSLDCHRNQLTYLDLSKNIQLEVLNCSENQLTSLEVNFLEQLTNLDCSRNKLAKLDLSSLDQLEALDCRSNELTSLDLSNNTQLRELRCDSNQITSLDVSRNIQLRELICYYNQLTSLDLSKNIQLRELSCSGNQLTSLDLSNNAQLEVLNCFNIFPSNDYLLTVPTERLIDFRPNDSAKELLIRQKWAWEGKVIEKIKNNRFTNQISIITLLQRYQRASRGKLLENQKAQLEFKLKDLEDQLNELKELRSKLEERNKNLEILISESEFQISSEKQSITESFLSFSFSEEEGVCCKQLIKLHEDWFQANSSEQHSQARKINEQIHDLRKSLEEKFGTRFNDILEMILAKFHRLYENKGTLEKQLKEKENNPLIDQKLADIQTQLEKGIVDIKTSLLEKEFKTVQYHIAKMEKIVNQGIISQGNVSSEGNATFSNNRVEYSEARFTELFEQRSSGEELVSSIEQASATTLYFAKEG
jgi:Leucine-rich repeat (LRR) protein